MKTIELMLGDWVEFQGEYYQIATLKKSGVIELQYSDGTLVPITTSYIEDVIKPITLTREILELNGWRYTNDHTLKGGQTYVKKIEYKAFYYTLTFKFAPYEYFKLESYDQAFYTLFSTKLVCEIPVHKFQHLLRDCGLDELADNFKVK